ncbi:MAG: hypothetical protein ABIN36_07945 [Ferruginibacter sp.]
MHTVIFYNIYYYFRFPFLALVFQTILSKKNPFVDYFIKLFYIISIPLFFICFYLYHGLYKQLHTIYLLIGGVFVIINCLLLFYESIKNDEIINPFAFPFFISTMALFLYFLVILPFFGVINFLVASKTIMARDPALVAKVMSTIFYSLISVDYYLQWKRTKSQY